MANTLHLNNFRFSIYIDADGTVTLTDLPLELRDVAQALDPSLSAPPSAARDMDQHHHIGPCGSGDRRTRP
jgi:hypothetical protein